MKPNLFSEVVALLCAFNLCGYLLIDRRLAPIGLQVVVFTVIILISFGVIWRFAAGAYWAWSIVLMTCGVALLNLFTLGQAGLVQRFVIIAEAAFAAFLLYWLFTAPVRQYFASGPRL